jgi:hypothetical protein
LDLFILRVNKYDALARNVIEQQNAQHKQGMINNTALTGALF